jgi:hypothetical protein
MSNLTICMYMGGCARLTNGFSEKIESARRRCAALTYY